MFVFTIFDVENVFPQKLLVLVLGFYTDHCNTYGVSGLDPFDQDWRYLHVFASCLFNFMPRNEMLSIYFIILLVFVISCYLMSVFK